MRGAALPFWRDGGFRGRASRDAPIVGRARCQSARYAPNRPQAPCRARDGKGVGHRVATTEPPPSPALRSRTATGSVVNSQRHQPSPQDVSRETFVPIPRLAHISPARGSAQAGAEPIACSVFGRKTAPMPMLPEANSGRSSSEDLATWAYAVRLSENLARPARNTVQNWHGCRFAPTSLAAALGRARMFHVKHSFVAWGGAQPARPAGAGRGERYEMWPRKSFVRSDFG